MADEHRPSNPRDVLAEIAALNAYVRSSILGPHITIDLPGTVYDALYAHLTLNGGPMATDGIRPVTITVLGRRVYRISEAPRD